MTLDQAFTELIASEEFKNIAKQPTPLGSKYRVYTMRYNRGELKAGAIVEILLANGYTVYADKGVKNFLPRNR
jgi:hypothetical protein